MSKMDRRDFLKTTAAVAAASAAGLSIPESAKAASKKPKASELVSLETSSSANIP
jgi:anaerobic selenocysteine-containing dehydrogenase